MRAFDKTNPWGQRYDVFSRHYQKLEHQHHMERLRNAQPHVKVNAHREFAHLKHNPKKEQLIAARQLKVETDNRLLLQRISSIMRKPAPAHEAPPLRGGAFGSEAGMTLAGSLHARRMGPVSLNAEHRLREMQRIRRDNLELLHRIETLKPVIDNEALRRDAAKARERLRSLASVPNFPLLPETEAKYRELQLREQRRLRATRERQRAGHPLDATTASSASATSLRHRPRAASPTRSDGSAHDGDMYQQRAGSSPLLRRAGSTEGARLPMVRRQSLTQMTLEDMAAPGALAIEPTAESFAAASAAFQQAKLRKRGSGLFSEAAQSQQGLPSTPTGSTAGGGSGEGAVLLRRSAAALQRMATDAESGAAALDAAAQAALQRRRDVSRAPPAAAGEGAAAVEVLVVEPRATQQGRARAVGVTAVAAEAPAAAPARRPRGDVSAGRRAHESRFVMELTHSAEKQ